MSIHIFFLLSFLSKQPISSVNTRPVWLRALWKTNIASALGRVSQLFLAFVPNLFCSRSQRGKRFGWPERVHGNDINSQCSCKAARFAPAEAPRRSATSAESGEMRRGVSPRTPARNLPSQRA